MGILLLWVYTHCAVIIFDINAEFTKGKKIKNTATLHKIYYTYITHRSSWFIRKNILLPRRRTAG